MPDPTPQPESWDRQAEEPNLWFSRFERYRLAGPGRSLLATVNAEQADKGKKKHSGNPGAWTRAAACWHWRERAEAWDEHQRQQARAAHVREVEEMNRRHIQEAQALQNRAVQRLKSLDHQELSASDTLRYFVEATKLERTARGEPETIEERRLTGKGGGPVVFSLEDALLADEELENWKHDRLQPPGGGALSEGNPEMP
jgi:hypothetical protein